MNAELTGKVALVTGGARNIGRAISLALAQGGASVMVNALSSRTDAEKTVAQIRESGGKAELHIADVTRPEQVKGLVEATVAAFGGLDLLVHNAAHRDAGVGKDVQVVLRVLAELGAGRVLQPGPQLLQHHLGRQLRPLGLDFLMGSNLRYAIPAALVGVAVASAVVPVRVFVAGLVAAFAYNVWRIGRGAGFRTDLDISGSQIAVVCLVAGLAAGLALLWRGRLRVHPAAIAVLLPVTPIAT